MICYGTALIKQISFVFLPIPRPDRHLYFYRIERMWRDVWMAVTCIFYDVLHTLEEDGVLDIANIMHLFCVHYVFLPRLRSALQVFVAGWNHHPLRTERNHTGQWKSWGSLIAVLKCFVFCTASIRQAYYYNSWNIIGGPSVTWHVSTKCHHI